MYRIEARWGLMLAVFLLGGWPARAETAVQVSVDCTVPGMRAEYKDKLGVFLDQLSVLLVQDLQGVDRPAPKWRGLALWNFAKQGSEVAVPQLKFLVFKAKAGPIKLSMEYSFPLDPRANDIWEAQWMERGAPETDGYPNENDLVGILRDFIHESVIKPNLGPLSRALEASAPLAEGGSWDPKTGSQDPKVDLRVVLPLPWVRYGPLSRREFRLACVRDSKAKKEPPKGKGADEIELLSCGTGLQGMFDKSIPPYPAVLVVPKFWRRSQFEQEQPFAQIRNSALQIRPLRAFLYNDSKNLCPNQPMEVISQ
jgi:hypothetical protein